MTIEMLRQKVLGLHAEAKAIHEKAAAEQRPPTPEELDKCDAILAEYRVADRQLKSLEEIEDLNRMADQSRGRAVTASAAIPLPNAGGENGQGNNSGRTHSSNVEQTGFRNFGEFAKAVRGACTPGGFTDPRLRVGAAASTTYVNEGTGADGGFLVPTSFSSEVERHSHVGEDLLSRCNPLPIPGNSMEFPVDETVPWGTDGVQAYWIGEAGQYTERKVALQMRQLSLHKLGVLVPVSDEMMEDAPTLAAYITPIAGEKIGWKVNDAIINGNGAGKPLGILNSSCIVTQTKESGQTADTINATNVGKMFGRMVPDSISDAIWLIAPDAFHQLPLMTIGQMPVWVPPGRGIADAPGGMLMGRPVFISMTCQTVGDLGDFYFGAFKRYKAIVKRGGIDQAISMHLYFDYGLQAFRFTFRVNGSPWLKTAISPAYGSTTLSPFVMLQAR